MTKHGISITITKSPKDDVPVVQIDTDPSMDATENNITRGLFIGKGPVCRIYLNDHCLHENPSYPGVKASVEAIAFATWTPATLERFKRAICMATKPSFVFDGLDFDIHHAKCLADVLTPLINKEG